MGNHVTILRTHGGVRRPIDAVEVTAALARLQSGYVLAPDARADARLSDPTAPDEADVMFLQAGELWASAPSDTLLALMIELARELGARLRGDRFETYRTPAETYIHPDDVELLARLPLPAQAEPTRRAISALIPIGVGMLLGILVLFLRR